MKKRKYGPTNFDNSTDAAYLEGFESGRNWTASHIPGGPHVIRPVPGDLDREWKEFCDQMAAEKKAWLMGWNDGRVGVPHNRLQAAMLQVVEDCNA